MAKIEKLKTGKDNGPPPPAAAPGNVDNPPRERTEATKPLQFKVPESEFEAFSAQAGKEFSWSKGAKSELFLKMWEHYKRAHA
jgi:hypothetical protein